MSEFRLHAAMVFSTIAAISFLYNTLFFSIVDPELTQIQAVLFLWPWVVLSVGVASLASYIAGMNDAL